jgi:hypothetical protein
MKKWLLVLLVIAMIVIHQDGWLWDDKTLVGGVLPIGLAYHALYTVLASITMALLVHYAWPSHLEQPEREGEPVQEVSH